jgi:hypothetical protein
MSLIEKVANLADLIELYSIRLMLKDKYSYENIELLIPISTKSLSDQKSIDL